MDRKMTIKEEFDRSLAELMKQVDELIKHGDEMVKMWPPESFKVEPKEKTEKDLNTKELEAELLATGIWF